MKGILMARKTIYTDDLEEGDVEADAGTISFALEGTRYEIDLSTKNATKLRSLLGPYVTAARATGKLTAPTARKSYATKPAASGYGSDQLNAIREWARKNGYTVAEKGRIRNEVMHAFEQAQESMKDKTLFSAASGQ